MSEYYKNRGLTPLQKRVIPLLLSEYRQSDALKQAGISRVTLNRWMKQEAFRDELKRRRNEIVEQAFDRLKVTMTKAANVLAGLLDSENEFLRRLSANDIITHVLKARELQDIAERIEALEKVVETTGGDL